MFTFLNRQYLGKPVLSGTENSCRNDTFKGAVAEAQLSRPPTVPLIHRYKAGGAIAGFLKTIGLDRQADMVGTHSSGSPLPAVPPPVPRKSAQQVADEWMGSQLQATERSGLRKRFRQVEARIQTGAVVLGENHACSSARALVCELISSGRAKSLFLELGDIDAEVFDGPSDKTIGEYLRDRMGQRPDGDPVWENLKTTMGYRDKQFKGVIPLSEVIALAIEANVPTYFTDNVITRYPGSISGMRERNKGAAQEFLRHAKSDSAGAIILIGGGHLTEARSGDGERRSTIQQYAKIGQDQVFDFSIRYRAQGTAQVQ